MNQISSWSIKNPIPIILMFILLTIGGVIGFMGMRINNNPDIAFPWYRSPPPAPVPPPPRWRPRSPV